ncbi:hypothetical protein ACROYT_G028102 [Oculina patagonica]
MTVWIILLILGMANGDQNVEFDISETKVFSASLECSPRYRTTDKIECQFHLKNEGQRNLSVLKWRTPLVQLTSDCLSVMRKGKKVPYDGIFMKRSTPGPDQFVLVAVGQTVSSTFDISEGYDMSKTGTYSVAVDTYIEYAIGSVKGAKCEANIFAYTSRGTRTIYLCSEYQRAPSLSGFDTKMSTIVHELTHALADTNDFEYGVSPCKTLAKSAPHLAANNGDNYAYFTASLFPFNYGFDAMTTLSNGYIYLFKENMYVRYTDSSAVTPNPAYPVLINDRFENLPEDFTQGFDSFFLNDVYGHAFATKGSQYIRFEDGNVTTVDFGYPRSINWFWWGVSGSMSTGFDSSVQLPTGLAYVTRGPLYVRYSDKYQSTVDAGYPKRLDSGEWGNLPENFESGFDAMAIFPDGKLYVTKGTEYLRYSNPSSLQIDDGYPKPIKGDWGNVPQ